MDFINTNEEEIVIRQKLLSKEINMKRTAKKFVQFQSCIVDDLGTKECEEALENVFRELELFQFSNLSKSRMVSLSTEKQMETYKIEEYIKRIQIEIGQLKEELGKERQIRKNKEEYDVLLTTIHQLPSRETTNSEIELLDAELSQLEKDTNKITNQFELRKKQFSLLLYSLQQLDMDLLDDVIQKEEINNIRSSKDENIDKENDENNSNYNASIEITDTMDVDKEFNDVDNNVDTL